MVEAVPAKGNIFGRWIAARYILAILGFIALAIIYGLKVNLSVAMVAMINHTALQETTIINDNNNVNNTNDGTSLSSNIEICEAPGGQNTSGKKEEGQFIWSEPLQGTILSCYFWGYLVSQIPGGRVSELYSAKWVMLFAVSINIICTILTPILTKAHYIVLIILRVLEGIGGGVTFPAMHSMLAHWAPPSERSVMSAIVYTGTGFGTAVSILLAGVLASQFGWESIFYVMGGLSCLWVLLWLWLIQDTPNKQPLINQDERDYINKELGVKKENTATSIEKKQQLPWRKVFTSLPFLAILISHICSNWGWYMFLIEIPFYLKQVLKFDVASNAVYSAIPYFIMLICNLLLSRSLDFLQSKGKITTTTARKIATLIASLIPIICVLTLCFIGCRHTTAVVIMCIGIVTMGAMFCGFLANHIDIAPNYAGTLMALTNTVATIPGIIVPIFVGFITRGNQTIDAWRIIFYVTAGLLLIEMFVYTIFGSGVQQPWNESEKHEDEENPLNEKSQNEQQK